MLHVVMTYMKQNKKRKQKLARVVIEKYNF